MSTLTSSAAWKALETDRNFKACSPRGAQPVVPTRDARHERPLVGSTAAPYAPRGASDVFMTMNAGHRRFAPGSFTRYSDVCPQ